MGADKGYDCKAFVQGRRKLLGQALPCFAAYKLVRMGGIGGWWDAHHASCMGSVRPQAPKAASMGQEAREQAPERGHAVDKTGLSRLQTDAYTVGAAVITFFLRHVGGVP